MFGATIAARATTVMMVADTKKTTGLKDCVSAGLPSGASDWGSPGVSPGVPGGEVRSGGWGTRSEGPSAADSLCSLVSGDRLTDLLRSSWGLMECCAVECWGLWDNRQDGGNKISGYRWGRGTGPGPGFVWSL